MAADPQQPGASSASTILSRDALAASSERGLENSAWIDGAFTAFRKTGPGLEFAILMSDPQLSALVEDPEALAELKAAAEGTDGESPTIVGRYCAGDAVPDWARNAGDKVHAGADGVWWTTVDDERLIMFVADACEFLEARLARLGQWTSFADWARSETGADLTSEQPLPVTPLDYWWLAGPTGTPGVHHFPVYPANLGVYVPDDGLIRVYSCMMKAALAEAAYSAAAGAPVQSSPLPCVGCLLAAAAESLGRDVVKGALLDDRWPIEFAVCEEHGSGAPAHFSVFDGDEAYDLIGCATEGDVPLWIPHAWNVEAPHEITAWA